MSRTPVGKPISPKKKVHFEVESLETGEWASLSYRQAPYKAAQFSTRFEARAIAKEYGRMHNTSTRVVRVD